MTLADFSKLAALTNLKPRMIHAACLVLVEGMDRASAARLLCCSWQSVHNAVKRIQLTRETCPTCHRKIPLGGGK